MDVDQWEEAGKNADGSKNKFKYEIPGSRFMPAVRLGRWDGTVSFFSQGGLTYVNLLDEIIPLLEQYNYTFDLTDERQPYDLHFDNPYQRSFSNYNRYKTSIFED